MSGSGVSRGPDNSRRPKLVVASANPGKVAELVDLLGDRYQLGPRPLDLPETVEDGDTLEANAIKKASEVAAHTGAPALADDTGLFVAALGGAPGVRTARYAGEEASDADNRTRLLAELIDHREPTERAAVFRTVMALVEPDGSSVVAEGEVAGTITVGPRGQRGFGYDPVFAPDEGDGRTFAEMSMEEKQRYSHRARALGALAKQLL